jgi:nitrogen fixation-related uncharacterized protein
MRDSIIALAMPGPMEMIILLVIAAFGIAFVFLLLRFLWRAGSKPVDDARRREG